MREITFIRPDDWHCHLRDHEYLARTVTDAASQFQRVMVMPNLLPPVTTLTMVEDYLKRIQQHIPSDSTLTPLMTLYLTELTSVDMIMAAKQSGSVMACKWYPAGATTHSEAGISRWEAMKPLWAAMEAVDMPLLIHGEVTDPSIDIFDRETVFIEQCLSPLCKNFPQLRVVLEHISTKTAIEFVQEASDRVAATITPHHLFLNRNDLLVGGIRPHHFCYPVVKTRMDQAALLRAAMSGHPRFFLGTDSAPHVRSAKESACGPAGIYTTNVAIAICIELFEQQQALQRLENFTSRFGAEFYQLPIHSVTTTWINQAWEVPLSLPFGQDKVVPFLAGKTLHWQMKTHD